MRQLSLATLVVHDYDEAIRFYVDAAGFELIEDTDQGSGRRWVVVRPVGSTAGLLLARAKNDAERAAVGHQTGGRVAFFVQTDDFGRDHARMVAHGVRFREEPRHEPYGTVAVWEDLYGTAWDLIGPAGLSAVG